MNKNKKVFVAFLLSSLLSLSVAPYLSVSAQSCDPDGLRPVSYGQRGAVVKNVQACLMEAGYDIPAGATGYYGAQTRSAVKAFYGDWYGSWHGNNLGPKGVAQLKEMLASGSKEPEEDVAQPTPTSTTPGGPSISQDTLMQVLTLLLSGNTQAALALLQTLGLPVPTTTATTTQTQPVVGQEEGILIVEQNPTPASGQQFREGESVTWVGVKFTAQDANVSVKSFKLVWPTTNNVAPQRAVTEFQVVDDQGNVLKTIPASSFVQDNSTLEYYYYVTGLDYLVSKGSSRPLFVKATAVSTFPSGVPSTLDLKVSDIRGRDTAGIDRFPSTSVTNRVNKQATLATSARFDVSRNSGSPVENNVLADVSTGRADNVEMLRFDLMARNDKVKLMKLTVSVPTASATVATLYLKDSSGNTLASANPNATTGLAVFSNLTSQNIWVEKDQTKTFSVYADVTGVTNAGSSSAVTLVNVESQNSLGDTTSTPATGVVGDPMHFFTVAPLFAKGSTFNVAVTRDQNNSTTTANATLEILITAKGGQVKVSATSSPFAVKWETNSGQSTTTNVNVAEVRDSSGNIVNSSGDLYTIPVNQTYRFTLQGQRVFSGAPRVRVTVEEITWGNDGANATSTFVKRFLITDWSN